MPNPRWSMLALLLCPVGCRTSQPALPVPSLGARPPRSADLRLVVRVRDRLLATRGLSGIDRRVGVEARDGVVSLLGRRPTEARRQALVRAVRGVPGVLGVVDRLEDPGGPPPEDDDADDPPEVGRAEIVSHHTITRE